MTILQVRTSPPQSVNLNDAFSIVNKGMDFVGSSIPKLIAIAYFAVVCIILWRLFKAWRGKQAVPMMELVGIGVLFGLMR